MMTNIQNLSPTLKTADLNSMIEIRVLIAYQIYNKGITSYSLPYLRVNKTKCINSNNNNDDDTYNSHNNNSNDNNSKTNNPPSQRALTIYAYRSVGSVTW